MDTCNIADTSSMTGDDIVGQLQQWCIDQAAKSASDLKRLQGQMEGKIKDLEGRMNNLSINIATQVASDVNLRLENCMQQTKMDLQDFKSEIYQEIKTAVNEAIKKALLRAANPTGITVDDEQPSTPLPCESTPMPTNSTPLPECSLVEEQQAEPPRETRFVQSIDDIPTEWHATLLPFLPKEMPISERLNRVQVAFLNFLINKKDLKGNKESANFVIKEGRILNLWKPPGKAKSFQEYMSQNILNITKRAKLCLSRRHIDLDKMNSDLEKEPIPCWTCKPSEDPAEEKCMEEADTGMEV